MQSPNDPIEVKCSVGNYSDSQFCKTATETFVVSDVNFLEELLLGRPSISFHLIRPVFDEKVILIGNKIIHVHEYGTPTGKLRSIQETSANGDFVPMVVNSVTNNRIRKRAYYFSQLCPLNLHNNCTLYWNTFTKTELELD